MNLNNIPKEMQVLPQWAVFRNYTDKFGKHKKVIISPVNSKFALCNQPETWADFETAKRYCMKYRYKGLVFALTKGITFIDIDHAIDKNTGVLSEEAKQLMRLLPDTYTEKSVSGTGIHILMRGSLPKNARNRNDKKGLEMYDKARFVCVTGDLLSDSTELKDYSDLVPKINREFIGVRPRPAELPRSSIGWSPSDSELLDKIRNSKIGERFDVLYSTVPSEFDNHSSLDYAFCSLLAWWTQDEAQIDRIVRSSALYRPKWDESRGSQTYGALTIRRALEVQSSRYEPRSRNKVVYVTPAEM